MSTNKNKDNAPVAASAQAAIARAALKAAAEAAERLTKGGKK